MICTIDRFRKYINENKSFSGLRNRGKVNKPPFPIFRKGVGVLGKKSCMLTAGFLLLLLHTTSGEDLTVYFSLDGTFELATGILDSESGAAWGIFKDDLLETGWGELNIRTSSNFEDHVQARSAGIVEGYLTAKHITNTVKNLIPSAFKGADRMPDAVQDFMNRQENWTDHMVASNSDPFFWHVGLIRSQYEGLVFGFHQSSETPLPRWAFQMLNGLGDLFDIMPAVMPEHRVEWSKLKQQEAEVLHSRSGHCSGFVKLVSHDLFFSHSSWFTFSNSNRIFKHYWLDFQNSAAKGISFSSYPGFLNSLDDFYMLSSGLSWIQTTNTVLDHSVYSTVSPESLLAWQRVRVASALATSGADWYNTFKRHPSGTYANQYTIVDLNKFTPHQTSMKNGTIWVVEEMPGLVVGQDQSMLLQSQGYWPSYNVPFYPEIYKRSGYPAMVEKFGSYWTYHEAPRAKIFRRDHSEVHDLSTLKTLMRYNNYTTDPLSFDGNVQNPTYAICARGDFQGSTSGCYDTKISSFAIGGNERVAHIVNGPTSTASGGSLPAFAWSKFQNVTHVGLPPIYDFPFITTKPKLVDDGVQEIL